jgi:hypothetical protein
MYCVLCKVLLSIVAVWRVTLCCTYHGGFGVWVPVGKRGFSVFQNVQPAICLVPGALPSGIQHWMYEADPSPCLVPRCTYASTPHGLVLLHTGSMPLFSSWFCLPSHRVYRPCKVCFVCASHWVLFASCAKINVIILHFLSSSLWNWYNKFVNDWCVFGEVCVNILSCVLSSKVYLCRFCRETNVLTIAGSCLLTPHLPFTLAFSVV